VRLARAAPRFDRHAVAAHPFGVGEAFVAQRIAAADHHDRGRQPRETVGLHRQREGVVVDVVPACVRVVEHVARLRADHDAVELGARRIRRVAPVDHRVDQHLAGQGDVGRAPEPERNRGRQVAARAFARDRDAFRVGAEAHRVGERPLRHRHAVVEARRERMLGREPVLDRHNGRAGAVRELAGDVVHQSDAADAEPAAVEIHDDSGRRGVVLVDADGDAVDDVVGDLGDLARRGSADRRPRQLQQLR